jgi:hypothetical protein
VTSDTRSDHDDLDVEEADVEPDLDSDDLEPDEEDLEDADVDELALEDDEVSDDEDLGLEDGVAAVDTVAVGAKGKVAEVPAPAAEADSDDEEDLSDDVEASLDVILAERLRSGDADTDDIIDDADDDGGTPTELASIIPVRRPEEFLCQSCFLLKPPSQLADADHQLCRDCA